jgi:hypothetical protein
MNANELADYLKNKAEVELNPRLLKTATMLRQQQAEIDRLLTIAEDYQLYIKGQNRKILDLSFAKVYAECSLEIKDEFNALTDGEITILANKHLHYIESDYESTGIYEFARAVLKEAKG